MAVAAIAFFALLARYTAPRLFAVSHEVVSLARVPMEERRRVVLGGWYPSVQAIRRAVPPRATVDIVILTPGARDIAILAGAALHPRDCRFFEGWEAWERRSRADFMHDARAANAPAGPPPPRAEFVITADPRQHPPLRIESR